MAEEMIGRVLSGRYKITERVGIGGMAEVYRAEDTVLGRVVAVKIMLPQYVEDQTFAQRFRQEAAAAANLQSPYIVNIYDWGQDQGIYYIVMEYVRGSDLKTGIRERGHINPRKVAEIGEQVCRALAVAHHMDIIHRDIKPQNIMVQPDGNVKVMDFGIAQAKNSLEQQTSTVLGTAHYISPEQAQGKELTAASDIYSLGVVLYEAATGKLPFDGPDAVSVALMQVNDEAEPPHKINPQIPGALEAVICKAMAKDPRDRYATANEMRADLTDYLTGKTAPRGMGDAGKTALMNGVAAIPTISPTDRTMVMPSNIRTANGRHVAAVSPASTGGFKAKQIIDAPEKEPKRRKGLIIAIIALLVAFIGVGAFFLFGQGDAVPDVTNQTLEEAKTTLENAGFEVGRVDHEYSTTAQENYVISQDPAKNQRRPRGSKVNLVVSLGIEQTTVPDLHNMTATEAQAALEKAGLKASVGEGKYSSDVEINHVVEQDIKAGETVDKGTTVTYMLSLGVESVEIPNVVGQTHDSAIEMITSAGLTYNTDSRYSDSVSEGYVISQSPSSGGKLDKGQAVTIVISLGPDTVDIPYVVNMTVTNARAALETAGFVVDITGDSSPNAVVISQSPSGKAKSGSTITIEGAASEGSEG